MSQGLHWAVTYVQIVVVFIIPCCVTPRGDFKLSPPEIESVWPQVESPGKKGHFQVTGTWVRSRGRHPGRHLAVTYPKRFMVRRHGLLANRRVSQLI
jgi:hypothetical protein